jgi:ubiquinone/menaquinone biosynthesis C-methylase UbiE
MMSNSAVQTHFSKLAEDGVWASLYSATDTITSETWSFLIRARRVAELLQASGNTLSTVVDIGCGTAPIARSVTAMGSQYVGMDFSAEMIKAAGQSIPDLVQDGRARLLVGDVTRTGLPDRCCDAVVAMGVIEYLSAAAVDTAAKEMWRILRPGGVVILTIPKRHHWETILLGLLRPLRQLFRRPVSGGKRKLNVQEKFERLYLTPGELDAACRRAGLPRVDQRHYNLQPLCRPVTSVAPRFAYLVNHPFETLARVPVCSFLATGYIGMYRRPLA